ncbi:uncharacterized protein LOC130048253 [Ostrea edulis]|uniref:uncharacterized protein LOC130048253 n=1 Tax=Ostrea edulis TaxID=37623 RepID=UPI0024AEAC53|nr:uncharacterized protein LOC130048253 [Ostrea edulis]
MASDIQTEKAELETNYRTLTTAADQQGEVWHREINVIVNQRKSDIQEMKNKHLSSLNKNTDQITQKIMELKQIISDLKSMLKSNDASLTSTYKSRNSEFRTLVPKVGITLPRFFPQKMNKDRLSEMFGSLSPLSINTENSPEAISSPLVKPLLDEPRLTATIDTRYASLFNVTCLSEEVWTCGDSKILQLLNLQGKLLTSIETESGVTPYDIAVTLDGDLVYTDTKTKTVNIVKNKQIQIMITIQGWRPISVCSTSSDDLLVFMVSNDFQQSKVVRYSDSKETQTIQFNDQGQPLYSHEYNKYICENRNLDICVSDFSASAVVVVNQSGRLRFRYMGHSSDTEKSFKPRGITTDSQSHILTSDCDNDRIHILDQDGHFLCYIQNCDLKRPYGLCVDIRDNLFVAERHTAKVKKIQYI